MTSLLSTIIGVFGYILIGFVINKINIIPNRVFKIFNYVSFNVLLPFALIANFLMWNEKQKINLYTYRSSS